MSKEDKNLILPLFSQYLLEEVFPYSLVGKIGIFGEGETLPEAQKLIDQLSSSFSLTDNQKNIKKFAFPFHFWGKDTRIFSHLLEKLARKSLLVNTVIPLNYSYFLAERTIKKFFNFRKIRFHGLDKLEKSFKNLTQNVQSSPYQVKIHTTDSVLPLTSSKKMLRLIQRGQSIEIERC